VSFKSFARGLLLLEKGPTPSVLAGTPRTPQECGVIGWGVCGSLCNHVCGAWIFSSHPTAMAGIVLGVAEDTEQDVTLDQFVDGVRRFSAMVLPQAVSAPLFFFSDAVVHQVSPPLHLSSSPLYHLCQPRVGFPERGRRGGCVLRDSRPQPCSTWGIPNAIPSANSRAGGAPTSTSAI
jgi:hypothetical protein